MKKFQLVKGISRAWGKKIHEKGLIIFFLYSALLKDIQLTNYCPAEKWTNFMIRR